MKMLFFLSLFLILYTYFFYPLLIWGLDVLLKRRNHVIDENFYPTVSLVVIAHNEEEVIREKIENSLSLDYPKEKFQIIMASDNSTDRTNEIMAQYTGKGICFMPILKRGGKSKALNLCIPKAQGEIIVLSDANTLVHQDAVRKLVRHFADPVIGCVSGKLRFRPVEGNPLGMIESRFWNYETWVKKHEGNLGFLPGANGGIYAIRKSVFHLLPTTKAIMDDFIITLNIIAQGYRAISDPEVRALEDTCVNVQDSFEQKVRIGAANFHGLPYIYHLLNPAKGFVAYILWSHKIIRWFLPFFLLILLISNLLLLGQGLFYQYLAVGQSSFYLTACLGYVGYLLSKQKKHSVKVLS